MEKYSRISEKERFLVEMLIKQRVSIRQIAARIGRPAKTVWSEIKRNGGLKGYYAAKAHAQRTLSNRQGYSKISRKSELVFFIRERLDLGWGPVVIAGVWNKQSEYRVSAEAIYQWIYKQPDKLYLKLARKKKARGLRPQRSKSKIPNRTSIHERPESINNRCQSGHYEADLVFQQGNKSHNILSVVERKSRMIMLRKNNSKRTAVIMKSIDYIQRTAVHQVKTLTVDNGTEFTAHHKTGIPVYFCDPASPWQKGAIENVNAILRRHLDYRLDPNLITQEMLDSVAHKINNIPRKILDFLTPYQVAMSRVKTAMPAAEAVQ